jgi:hypothetical protein
MAIIEHCWAYLINGYYTDIILCFEEKHRTWFFSVDKTKTRTNKKQKQ